MNNAQPSQESRSASNYLTTASFVILLMHYCIACQGVYHLEGLPGKLLASFVEKFQAMDPGQTMFKAFGLLVLIFPMFFSEHQQKERKTDLNRTLIVLVAGLLFYFGSWAFTPIDADETRAALYVVITTAGYLAIISGTGRLRAALSYRAYMRRFHRVTGFEQEERLIETDYSLHFAAKYTYDGRKRNSIVNIVNPRRGILIMGTPGSGKSWYIIEPMIEQLTQKGMALFVYDFKFPALTNFTYNRFLQHRHNYPHGARFFCVNFTDLTRSHRCNLIDPATLHNKNDAMGISRTILLSMNKTWASKQGEFFVESPINFLAALIWFLKVYKNGAYCTLPHVIELAKASYEELFTILNVEPETRGLIVAFKEAYLNKTMEMLDGQVASARIPLTRLDSDDFYYVLSGNDLQLDINNLKAPVVFCLGCDAERQEALAPIVSLYIDRLNKRINKPGGHPTALVLDEFATVRATSLLTTIATGRSNNITPVIAIQDLTQLTQHYSHDEAKQILNTAGNLICGQVSGETAITVSQRFHENTFLRPTVAVNSIDTSVSKTEHTEDSITPATLANLSAGEFVGMVADDPDVQIELKAFHSTFRKPSTDYPESVSLPIVLPVTAQVTKENYTRIGGETMEIIRSEMKRILGDPALQPFIVRR